MGLDEKCNSNGPQQNEYSDTSNEDIIYLILIKPYSKNFKWMAKKLNPELSEK